MSTASTGAMTEAQQQYLAHAIVQLARRGHVHERASVFPQPAGHWPIVGVLVPATEADQGADIGCGRCAARIEGEHRSMIESHDGKGSGMRFVVCDACLATVRVNVGASGLAVPGR